MKNVLILCTGNSARSILAECLFNQLPLCSGKFRAYSAGSFPNGTVNPLAIELLQKNGFDTTGLRSKSWDEFSGADAPTMDFIFTVCDQAAGEQCPYWPGQPMTAHWGIPDPAAVTGSEIEKRQAFRDAFQVLKRRIELFAHLPFEKLDKLSLQHQIKDIGKK